MFTDPVTRQLIAKILGGTELTAELESQIVALIGTILTTRGDMIRRGVSAPERVALGASGTLLSSDGTDAVYQSKATLNIASLNTEDQTFAGGARVTVKDLGEITSGTVTPDPGDRPMQKYENGGAHTLAPGTNVGSYLLTITNNASAGAITTSGWTQVAGDDFDTTDGNKFRCHCSIDDDGDSLLIIQAMQ